MSIFDKDPRWHALEGNKGGGSIDPKYKDVKTPGVANLCNELLRDGRKIGEQVMPYFNWCVDTILTIESNPDRLNEEFAYIDPVTQETKPFPPQLRAKIGDLLAGREFAESMERSRNTAQWENVIRVLEKAMPAGTIEGLSVIEARVQVMLAYAGKSYDVTKIPPSIQKMMKDLAPVPFDARSIKS